MEEGGATWPSTRKGYAVRLRGSWGSWLPGLPKLPDSIGEATLSGFYGDHRHLRTKIRVSCLRRRWLYLRRETAMSCASTRLVPFPTQGKCSQAARW